MNGKIEERKMREVTRIIQTYQHITTKSKITKNDQGLTSVQPCHLVT